MTSVAPSDSVSASGGAKKNKPGKAERAAKRAASSVNGVPASQSKAAAFASSGSLDPSPQPGKYPVVFATGAGEPTRVSSFCYDPDSLGDLAIQFGTRYTQNPKYAEFRAHAGVTDAQFRTQVSSSFVLGLAQQTVHSHVNLGLPQLDYAPIASTELRIPAAQLAVISQFGEFQESMLGTRYLLPGYTETVDRLVFAAQKIWNSGSPSAVLERSWLPMHSADPVTKLVVASALGVYLKQDDLSVDVTALESAVLSGSPPDVWETLKPRFGDPPGAGEVDRRDRFDFLFRSYPDVGQFTTAFTTAAATPVLEELSLTWANPQAGHLDWNFSAKRAFADLSDKWARLSASYAQFFELGSTVASRTTAQGSPAQFVEVSDVDVVTVVKTHLGLTAAQFSLAACFPPECVFSGGIARNVIVTTPIPVKTKATEFCQGDWR